MQILREREKDQKILREENTSRITIIVESHNLHQPTTFYPNNQHQQHIDITKQHITTIETIGIDKIHQHTHT